MIVYNRDVEKLKVSSSNIVKHKRLTQENKLFLKSLGLKLKINNGQRKYFEHKRQHII